MRAVFGGSRLDRAAARRADAAWVAERLADPRSRAVAAGHGGVALDPRDGSRLDRRALPAPAPDDAVLLGLDESGDAIFAIEPGEGEPLTGLREAAAVLPEPEAAIAAQAAALRGWHRSHQCCARCGAPTRSDAAGHVRACPSCGATHHPRTDPVVIMLVTDGDRVLLGRQPHWPAGRYSALAGFVEPGETLEGAVARAVLGESGVVVRDPRYVGSQPWPFPASLMLGFMAEHAAGEPETRDDDLEDVRWVTREELADAVAGRGPIGVPPREAIARQLIDAWLG